MHTAAKEGVIGDVACAELEQELNRRGLRPAWQQPQGPLPGAGSIGGAAVVKGVVNVPLGAPMEFCLSLFFKMDQIPIAWLESVGATSDCQNDQSATHEEIAYKT